jgi:hypothetical protein
MALNGTLVDWKGIGKKWLWPNLRIIPTYSWRDPQKPLVLHTCYLVMRKQQVGRKRREWKYHNVTVHNLYFSPN